MIFLFEQLTIKTYLRYENLDLRLKLQEFQFIHTNEIWFTLIYFNISVKLQKQFFLDLINF